MSGGNFQRTPFVRSIQQTANNRVATAIQVLGKALPATVTEVLIGCVTVKFEVTVPDLNLPTVTVPLGGAAGSEFIRIPVQVGTKGWVQPADARLGGVSGLGSTTTDLAQPANLGALVFEPIGNKGWAALEEAGQLELMGQTGVLVKSTKNKEWFARWTTDGVTISNKTGTASIAWNGTAWEFKGPAIFNDLVTAKQGLALAGNITAPGGGVYASDIKTSSDVIAGNISLKTHRTTGVTTGGGISGTPTP